MNYLAKIVFISFFSLFFISLIAQEDVKLATKEQRKAEKALKKKEKKEKEAAEWLIIQELAKSRRFVVKFNRVNSVKTGQQFILNNRLNFLSINGNKAVIQFETNPYLSSNGLGGLTFNGTVTNFKYKPPKNSKKPVYISFSFESKKRPGITNISLVITEGGNSIVTFGAVSNIYGEIVAPENANINTGIDMWD